MAFNKYMHPRNIYRKRPDFKELAINYPEFRQYAVQDLSGKLHIDFKDPDALRALTCTLLKRDFNLDIEIPKDSLIPTLPLRLNYVLWIEDLLSSISANSKNRKLSGLDIGTGTSCIYPLLGARKNDWQFVATESDEAAVEFAQKNVVLNNLGDRITVLQVDSNSGLSEAVRETRREFDFSMCNPPFFLNEADARPVGKGRSPFRPPPKTANSPSQHEAITEGGEVAFVKRMIEDSLLLKDNIKIYTTMLGKKQSLLAVQKLLHELGGDVIASVMKTEFCQGHTMRWGIAWTLSPDIKFDQAEAIKVPKEKPAKPMAFVLPKEVDGKACSFRSIVEKVEEILLDLRISFAELKNGKEMVCLRCTAMEKTWSNQRRKRRAQMRVVIADGAGQNGDHLPSEKQPIKESSTGSKKPRLDDLELKRSEPGLQPESGRSAQNDSSDNLVTLPGPGETVLESLLVLRVTGSDVVFEIQWLGGTLGKDSVQQILQYFKNRLK